MRTLGQLAFVLIGGSVACGAVVGATMLVCLSLATLITGG